MSEQSLTREDKIRGYGDHRSSALPCVVLLHLDGINAVLQRVALLSLLQRTQNSIHPSPPVFTPHFAIFVPDDGIAYFLIRSLCCVLFPYNSIVLKKHGKIYTNDGYACAPSYRNILPHPEQPYAPYTTFGRATLGVNAVASKLLIAFLFRGPIVGVYFLKTTRLIPSRPEQVRSVTSYTALPPIICVGEGDAVFKPREILLQRNDCCSSILLATFLIWNRKECPLYVFM